MSSHASAPRSVWGLTGLIFGIVALVIVLLQVSAVFSGPQPDTATTIGEIAAEIRKSAIRGMLGKPQPAPEPQEWTIVDSLMLLAPVLAGIAAILGGIGLFRREAPQLAVIAIAFGASAFVMQYAFWLALFIGGICLLIAIISNMDGILGG